MMKNNIISIAQNILMVLLFMAMLFQCVLYISLTQSSEEAGLMPFPESEADILASGDTERKGSGKSYVFPCFVGAVTGGEAFGGFYDDNAARDVFEMFAEVLENAPKGTAKKVYFSESEKKYEYLDKLYNAADNCYYIKLKSGFEFSVLCQLMSDTYTQLPENPDFEICDMFLVSGSLGEASITAVDSDGNVLKIYPSRNIPFNNEYLETYNNTEKNAFEFVRVDNNIQFGRNCYFPSFKYTVSCNGFEEKKFSDCVDISGDSNDVREFVSFFGMNDDNTRFYRRSSDGAMICVENVTSFEITPSGDYTFLPGNDGGKLENIVGKNDGVEYGFYEYTRAAQNIAGSFNKRFSQYCTVLSLADITYKDGECCFYYEYTVDGIPLKYDGEYALELRFSSDRLVYASGKIRIAEYTEKIKTSIPQRTAFALMDNSHTPVVYFGAEYSLNDQRDGNGVAVVRWTVKNENHGTGGLE